MVIVAEEVHVILHSTSLLEQLGLPNMNNLMLTFFDWNIIDFDVKELCLVYQFVILSRINLIRKPGRFRLSTWHWTSQSICPITLSWTQIFRIYKILYTRLKVQMMAEQQTPSKTRPPSIQKYFLIFFCHQSFLMVKIDET